MRNKHIIILAVFLITIFAIAGCGSSERMINKEASTSAIRAAQEVGASEVPTAALYLQLAKEGLEKAQALAAVGEKEQAESMLQRAQADAELAIVLSNGDADKEQAKLAFERVKKLQKDNK